MAKLVFQALQNAKYMNIKMEFGVNDASLAFNSDFTDNKFLLPRTCYTDLAFFMFDPLVKSGKSTTNAALEVYNPEICGNTERGLGRIFISDVPLFYKATIKRDKDYCIIAKVEREYDDECKLWKYKTILCPVQANPDDISETVFKDITYADFFCTGRHDLNSIRCLEKLLEG